MNFDDFAIGKERTYNTGNHNLRGEMLLLLLLNHSLLLRNAWGWKKAFSVWYNSSAVALIAL